MIQYIKSMPYNMIHLCIDECNEYKIGGYAYNTTIQAPIYFKDLYEVMLEFDSVFNKNGNPLSSHILRSFHDEKDFFSYQNKPQEFFDYQSFINQKGQLLECDIVVISRRQFSWQGKLFCYGNESSFENVDELIKLIMNYSSKVR